MVGLTKHIRYYVIRKAVGIDYGKNEVELVDPDLFGTLNKLIGRAGVNMTDYAIFYGLNFDYEIIDRNLPVSNLQDVYFIHRGLLIMPVKHIIRNYSLR